jgi:hypothetical protein
MRRHYDLVSMMQFTDQAGQDIVISWLHANADTRATSVASAW